MLRRTILAALCLTAAVAVTMAVLAGSARGRPGWLPQANAQEAPSLIVNVYGNTAVFKTLPQSLVSAELAKPSGTKFPGIGASDDQGTAQVQFFNVGGGGPGGGGAVSIKPGDSLEFSREGAKPLKLTVPDFRATVDTATDRVFGLAPAGASLTVVLTLSGASTSTMTRTVMAAADGHFSLDLAGQTDLQPGGVTGTATFDTPEHYRFVVRFAALSADVTLGARGMRGSATPGSRVGMVVISADGTRRGAGPVEVVGTPTYVLGGGGGPSAPQPLRAGDTLVVTSIDLEGASTSVTVTLQAVTVTMNIGSEAVSGNGPANTALAITADSMDNETARAAASTDAAGTFSLSLAGQADLGAGWRVRATYEAAPGVRIGALAVSPKIRVGVDIPYSQGRSQPGRPLTITLRTATGTVKTEDQVFVDDQGEYTTYYFGAADRVAPEPGDVVELAFVDADPVVLKVPVLTARSDVAADSVTGEAPTGTKVRVAVNGQPGAAVTADVDANGAYRAKLGGNFDLVRPSDGRVSILQPSGNEFYTTWAAIQLNATLGNTFTQNFVIGNGPEDRHVLVELVAPDGKVVAKAESDSFGGAIFINGVGSAGGAQFFVTLADITGTAVNMRPGDKLRVTAGDEVTEVTVPPLDGVIFVQQDTISGHTSPNTKVIARVSQNAISFTGPNETTSDSAGNFTLNLSGKVDIKFGDFVQLTTVVGGHNLQNFLIAPGLLLDLDQAVLLGSLKPNSKVTITLSRGGRQQASIDTQTDDSGAFMAQFADASGDPLIIQPGDVVNVKPADATIDPLTLTVPELNVTWDVVSDAIGGHATPGGSLVMLATDAYFRAGSLGFGQAWPEVSPTGNLAAEFVPSVNVRPGSRFTALYRPPVGHYVVRTRTVPILNAEHTGPNVCGYAAPRQDVPSTLKDAGGATVAGAAGKSRFDGYFSEVLADSAKKVVASAMSQTVGARLETAPVEIKLPFLTLNLNRQAYQLSGTGPVSTTYYIAPAVPCAAQAPSGVLNINVGGFAFTGRTRADGSFQTFLPPFINNPGDGLELAFYAPNDHRYFRHVYRPLGRIFIDTPRITGRATALSSVSITLQSAAGAARAQASTGADPSAEFAVQLSDAAAKPVNITAGDVVLLSTPDEAVTITVEALSFDWSAGDTQISGRAPVSRTVQLSLRLKDGRVLTLPRDVDATGKFTFGAAEVPPRGGWTMGDIAGVRVVLPTPNGHEIISETASFSQAPGGTGGRGRTIYLPAALRAGTFPRPPRTTMQGAGTVGELDRRHHPTGEVAPAAESTDSRPAAAPGMHIQMLNPRRLREFWPALPGAMQPERLRLAQPDRWQGADR